MQLTRDNVLWFAGLFEGEGHFEICKGRKSLGLTIKMTDRDVLEKAHRMFGGWLWDGQRKEKPHHKQAFVWKLMERDKAYAMVVAMFQFLGFRRQEQAKVWLAKYASLPTIGRSSRHGFYSTWVAQKCRCGKCEAAYIAMKPVLAERNHAYHLRKKETDYVSPLTNLR